MLIDGAKAVSGKPLDDYKGKCVEGKAIQVQIENNLNFEVALILIEPVYDGETEAYAITGYSIV